jgi:hypothetical protein
MAFSSLNEIKASYSERGLIFPADFLLTNYFVVILCDYYNVDETRWTDMEWKLIWHTFKQHIERKIIVVNFDQLEMKDNID